MPKPDATIASIRSRLLDGMREYMAEGDVSYDESDLRECDQLLEAHLRAVDSAKDADDAGRIVRKTVLALNALNERCDGELIETDQREDICELIIRAGFLRGFNAEDEDVTEEWREW